MEYVDTAVELFQSFQDYQNNFRGEPLTAYMRDHVDIPVFLVTLYLVIIFWVPNFIHKPLPCKWFFAFWNLCLTVFSVVGSYYTIPVLVRAIYEKGFRFSVCTDPDAFYYNGSCGFWVAMFILSKIPELMDTVFLVIQKKDVIFLHWFHHVTVMLYCWHSYTSLTAPGLWFAAMNFGVHSIMYFYYFMAAIGARNLVRPIARSITSLQILQMVAGMVVTISGFYWYHAEGEGCLINASNARMGLAMYSSYFYLFGVLYYNLYVKKGGKHRAGEKGAKGSEEVKKTGLCTVEEVQDGAGQFMTFDDKKKKAPTTTAGASPDSKKKK